MKIKITTSDLRLCNWLYYTEETKFPMQVSALGKGWVQLDFEGNEGDCFENNSDEIYPIPITYKLIDHFHEGWANGYVHSIDDVLFQYKPIDNEYVELYAVNADIHIKYVHELQNLYHVLTGKGT
jgi:hypothetical protein